MRLWPKAECLVSAPCKGTAKQWQMCRGRRGRVIYHDASLMRAPDISRLISNQRA
ncbi:hypothetical protein B0H10DRAFT_2089745 [Mycena sp. CBHHK59/15]|nr:hypothetical protein B0H10DRAFT_2092150 [Mycena sp. CBHHK59/15]KAJ6595952.1 hypothetical protein B0H10DRAFT_2089745 [Mycena sp. CBHHK59/15]